MNHIISYKVNHIKNFDLKQNIYLNIGKQLLANVQLYWGKEL